MLREVHWRVKVGDIETIVLKKKKKNIYKAQQDWQDWHPIIYLNRFLIAENMMPTNHILAILRSSLVEVWNIKLQNYLSL